jgi:CheY-like chemotaxis protein
VLVVEEDDTKRDVVGHTLSQSGYRVSIAANARMALDSLLAGRLPCVILLDLAMPIMDGWEFMMRRQRDAALARIPVALMSGSIDRRALVLDAEEYLNKPFDPQELLATVQRCCAVLNQRESSP